MTAPRFATVTLNAAIDAAGALPRLVPGEINRLGTTRTAAGGKGNNVARVLARLGCPVIATGFAAGHAGAFIAADLRAAGVVPVFAPVAGESRTCLTLVEADGRVTEIREPGDPVTAADGEAFLVNVAELIAPADRVAVCGSLPPGLDDDFYARLIATLRAAGAWVVLDTGGEPLRRALAARPDAIAPNREELADLVGALADDEAAIAAARTLARDGAAGCVLLTLGAAGAAYVDRERTLRAAAPTVPVANPVGAGDAFLAGWLAGSAAGGGNGDPAAALRLAVAAGAAAAMQPGIGAVDPADVERLRAGVAVNAAAVAA